LSEANPNSWQKTRGTRQQLIILRRQVKRPACTKTDRMLLVLLSRMVRTWKQALVIVQPETLLRWHRQGCKLFWKYKSRAASLKPRLSQETISLIGGDGKGQSASSEQNGFVVNALSLGIHVCLPHHSEVHESRVYQQAARTDLGHLRGRTMPMTSGLATRLPVTDLFFRSLFAFFIVELHSRRVIHVGVTRSPTDAWAARTATGGDCLWTRAEVSHP
jgi:putative transposase